MKTGFAAAAALCATAANALMYNEADAYLQRDGECYRNEWDKEFCPVDAETYDYYFDYQYVPKYQSYCLDVDRDVWFYCENNWGTKHLDAYIMDDNNCWNQDMGWFNCYEEACYKYGDEWACEALNHNNSRASRLEDAIEDVADDIGDALEDWAEDQRDQNRDLLDSIAQSTGEVIGNVGRNVTESLSDAVNQRFDRIMNETAQALNQTRREILDGIEDAQEDLMRELDGDDSDDDWEEEKWEEWNLNLLSNATNEQSNAASIAIGFTVGAATTFGLLMARKKFVKSDEDFQRA